MHIRFTPDIGQRITVSPSLAASHISSYVILRFDAVVGDGEYEKIRTDGTRLQLWTNCPFGTGNEWRDHDFAEDSVNVNKPDEVSRRVALYLSVVLPPGVDELEFSYTYRMLYPDGRVEWLGKFGQNGSCVVERHGSRVSLSDQWRCTDGITYDLSADGNSKSNLAILTGIDSGIFNLHAINFDGGSGNIEDCSLLFVIPKRSLDSCALTQSFSISSPPGSSISLSPAGIVTTNVISKTSLLLQVYDTRTDLHSTIGRALTYGVPHSIRILSLNSQNGILVLGSSNNHCLPVRLLGIGLFPWNSIRTAELELNLNDFRDILANASTSVRIYPRCHALDSILWEDTSTSAVKHISLSLGIQYTLSPEYRLPSPDGYWRISILSNYKIADIGRVPALRASLQAPRGTPCTPKESSSSAASKVPPVKGLIKTLIGFLGGYTRCCLAAIMTPISIFLRILPTFRLRSGKPKNVENRIVSGATSEGVKEGATETSVTSETITAREYGGFLQTQLCRSLSVRVFPGSLTILFSSEADATAGNCLDVPNIKMNDKLLDTSVQQKDDRTFLLTASIDVETDIEIVPA